MCLLDGSSGVGTPGQVIIEVDSQESEVRGPLHNVPIDEQGLNVCLLSPVVNNQFLGLGDVQSQVVFYTPHWQLLHLVPVCRLISPRDEPHHDGIISKLDDGVAGVGRGAVMAVEGVEKGTQHTALGRAGAEAKAWWVVAAYLHLLRAIGQKVCNPQADRVEILPGLTVWSPVCRGVGEDGVKCRAKVYKEQPRIAPPQLQVT